MAEALSFQSFVAEFDAGRERQIALAAVESAGQLLRDIREHSPVRDRAAALAAFDSALDELLSRTAVLLVFGSEIGVRALSAALGILSRATADERGTDNQLGEVLLARVVLITAATALAWERLEVLPALARVRRASARDAPPPALADVQLRHLALFGSSADDAFNDHHDWLLSRSWRETDPVLRDRNLAVEALATVDILGGCLVTIAPNDLRGRPLFAAGLRHQGRGAQDRLVRLCGDPSHRELMAALFSVPPEELRTTVGEAYERLTAGEGGFGAPALFRDEN